jgi:hypothetical protein
MKTPNQIWRVVGFYDEQEMSDETVPWQDTGLEAITKILRSRVARHLSPQELDDAVGGLNDLLEPRSDANAEHRLTISMGRNPHYVATLLKGEDLL